MVAVVGATGHGVCGRCPRGSYGPSDVSLRLPENICAIWPHQAV